MIYNNSQIKNCSYYFNIEKSKLKMIFLYTELTSYIQHTLDFNFKKE